ncbi:hypothetical protein [Azorhizobium doebereinerae]|uniref:hypothetical protein n=1 Tax=Azorhizobium doebereinerae TaxID=281091 RepID=UPI00040ACC42|nr:hypothetical protein [Azorhizobium doebereinerae]
MHHTGLDAFTARPARTALERRTVALAAYDAAKLDPVADWRTVADMLAAALPAPRAKGAPAAPEAEPAPEFTAWEDHAIPRNFRSDLPSPVVVFTFADGTEVRAPAVTAKRKPLNIGRAARVACEFYRNRVLCRSGLLKAYPEGIRAVVVVPAIISIEAPGALYDIGDANERTKELRGGTFDVAAEVARLADLPEKKRAEILRLRFIAACLRRLMLDPGANTKELAIQARIAEAAADGADFAELRALETEMRRPPRPPVTAIMRTYLGSTSRVALCVVAGAGEVAA